MTSAAPVIGRDRVAAPDLPAWLIETGRGAHRFVDWMILSEDTSALVLDAPHGYDVVTVSTHESLTRLGTRLDTPLDRWPAIAWRAAPTQDAIQAPAGWIALGDGGRVTGQRLGLAVAVDGDRIVGVHAPPGRLACDTPAVARSLTYLQLPALAERLNERTPATHGLLAALGVEALLDVEVPPGCAHARVFTAELERVQAHLAWLTSQAEAAGDTALAAEARAGIERIAAVWVAACGRRRPTGIHLPGRVAIDREAALAALREATPSLMKLIDGSQREILGRKRWRRRLEGLGVIETETTEGRGVTGPAARAAGGDLDVRVTRRYLTYPELEMQLEGGDGGDALARARVRLAEMRAALGMANRALSYSEGPLATSDVRVVPPATPGHVASLIHHFELWMAGHGLQPPEDRIVFVAVEAPEGELGLLLRSDGTSKPVWVDWRSPATYHYALMPALLQGRRLHEAGDLVASLPVNAGEMDR